MIYSEVGLKRADFTYVFSTQIPMQCRSSDHEQCLACSPTLLNLQDGFGRSVHKQVHHGNKTRLDQAFTNQGSTKATNLGCGYIHYENYLEAPDVQQEVLTR